MAFRLGRVRGAGRALRASWLPPNAGLRADRDLHAGPGAGNAGKCLQRVQRSGTAALRGEGPILAVCIHGLGRDEGPIPDAAVQLERIQGFPPAKRGILRCPGSCLRELRDGNKWVRAGGHGQLFHHAGRAHLHGTSDPRKRRHAGRRRSRGQLRRLEERARRRPHRSGAHGAARQQGRRSGRRRLPGVQRSGAKAHRFLGFAAAFRRIRLLPGDGACSHCP